MLTYTAFRLRVLVDELEGVFGAVVVELVRVVSDMVDVGERVFIRFSSERRHPG